MTRSCGSPLSSSEWANDHGAALLRPTRRMARRKMANVSASTVGLGGFAAARQSQACWTRRTLVARGRTAAVVDALLRDKTDQGRQCQRGKHGSADPDVRLVQVPDSPPRKGRPDVRAGPEEREAGKGKCPCKGRRPLEGVLKERRKRAGLGVARRESDLFH